MAPTGKNEGRGETSGPAGSKSDKDTDGAAVETSGDAADHRTDSGKRGRSQAKPIQVLLTAPLVYEVRTKKRKKKYSKGLKDPQRWEDGISLASKRLARSIEQGLRTYRRRRNKSARRKKDGAIRDGLENVSIGFGRTLRVASDAPYDLARKVNSKRFSRGLRNTIRFFTLPLFR
ncbi:MAG TPA: hypothetical protein VF666_15995 [Pyrinomonadaceae bacterium]|jgi:hypothetical protein